jgi:hypothetical protein
MAGPIAAAVVGGALSILGGAARNAAITQQANENYNNTLLSLGIQRGVEENNLLFQADQVNAQLGAELSNVIQEQRKAKANTVAQTTERNVYGATAARLQGQVDKDAAAMKDNIVQAGEAAMTNVQTNLTNAMYQYNNGVYAASQNRANALSQRQGALELLANGASSAFNFASGYRSMKGM